MWLAVIGGIGTCKNAVVNNLCKDRGDFTHHTTEVKKGRDVFEDQFQYLLARYRDCNWIKKNGADRDLLTVRSFWDTHRVFTEFYKQRHMINNRQYVLLTQLYEALADEVSPPQGFIYLKNKMISAHSRVSLTGGDKRSDEEVKMISNLYDQYVLSIRVPVIEIDVSRPFNEVIDEVTFGLDSIKTTFSFDQSVWQRRLF
jgi:hypothetical protein